LTKLISPDPKEMALNLKRSVAYFMQFADYCQRNPDSKALVTVRSCFLLLAQAPIRALLSFLAG
jgi:hypothetical protein